MTKTSITMMLHLGVRLGVLAVCQCKDVREVRERSREMDGVLCTKAGSDEQSPTAMEQCDSL
jgi:hypothetical protein